MQDTLFACAGRCVATITAYYCSKLGRVKSYGSVYFLNFQAEDMKFGTNIGLSVKMCETYFLNVLETRLLW